MENIIEDIKPAEAPPFQLLKEIQTQAATDADTSTRNIIINSKRNLPWFQEIPEFQKVKGKDKKIALIGGGPSIEKYVDDIKQFKTTMVCGSPNDWAMKNGIVPTYSVICDPDPISVNYFQKLDTETRYMLATCCDPKIFDHILKGNNKQVIMWHCHSYDAEERLKAANADVKYHYALGGGCTVGLRALSMAISMGYSNIHMFGYDSCLGENDKHHAYDFSDASEELGKIYKIKIGGFEKPDDDSRTFHCAGYQLAQAEHFRTFFQQYYNIFTPTIYGDGLIAEFIKRANKEAKKIVGVAA